MKNDIFIHKKYNFKSSYLKLLISLVPLILYGFYKNGILLFNEGYIDVFGLFKPLLFPIIGLLSGSLVNLILKRKFELNYYLLIGLIIGMCMPINTNILIFLLLPCFIWVFSIIEKKVSINPIAIIKLLLVIILLLMKNYEYRNGIEIANTYAFSFIDVIFGRGVGGICSSSILIIILSYLFLLSDYYYKKDITLYACLSFLLCNLLSFIFIKDFGIVVNNILSSSVLFAFVYIAPISMYSPCTKNAKIIFGLLIGILSGIFTFLFGGFEAAFISIMLCSIFKDIFDKYFGQNKTK